MPRAIWRGTVVAEADRVEMVEGIACFPSAALRQASSTGDMAAFRRGVEVEP
jgi:hypothetical protein